MAEEEKKEEKQESAKEPAKQSEDKSEDKEAKGGGFDLMTWLIPAGIVIAGLTGGFGLAQLLAGGSRQPEIPEVQVEETKSFEDLLADSTNEKKAWSYDIEPVIANLDEPGVTRHARVAVTLELSGDMDIKSGTAFLEEKKAVLRDWLTTYIAGLSLERVRGTSNLARIKKEIRDQFNELLFPEAKPFVVNTLFKEFAIQ
jgi:flagellar basal body-associated protein FliL